MLIVIGKVMIRSDHFERVMPLIKENAKYGMKLKGCIEGNVARSVENCNEVMIFSRWQSREDYEEAKKVLKKDSGSKKLMFQFLPHISKYETLVYEILPLDL